MTFHIGDTVRALPNRVKVPVGSVGRITGFSAAGNHPLVDFTNKGRCLIPADALESYDGPLTRTRPEDPDRVPLADELPPRAVAPIPERPVVDWAETPAPKIAVPQAVWTPTDSVSHETGNEDAAPATAAETVPKRDVPTPRGESVSFAPSGAEKAKQRGGWSEERREKFRATMAAKREGYASVDQTHPEKPTREAIKALEAVKPVPTPANGAETIAKQRTTPIRGAFGESGKIITPLPDIRPGDAVRHGEVASVRATIACAASHGLSSRSLLELSRLLVVIEEEAQP